MSAGVSTSVLSRAKCMFDLNGYIVVRNVLTATEVTEARAAIKEYEKHFVERDDQVRNTGDQAVATLKGDGKTGRFDLGGMLGWKKPFCDIFRKFLAHENLTPYLHLLLGTGYRLDHSPLVLRQTYGSEGFSLHGGPITSNGRMDRNLQYQCVGGEIHNSLLAVSFQLSDSNIDRGDGGFCVVNGSHKMNFPINDEMRDGRDRDFFEQCVQQPCVQPGDCIIFSEATIHGCMAWNNKSFDRYISLYRFAPATYAYGRGYENGWPEEYLMDMSKNELAVMQPPFNNRLDRERLKDDGSLGEPMRRSATKKNFDKLVFGQDYF